MADDTNDDEAKPDSIVAEAKKRFQRATDFYKAQRLLAVEDTRFAMGDSDNKWQWDQTTIETRKNDSRVILTVNMTAQHCNQIINNIRQNRPQCRVLPANGVAHVKTAEHLGGLIRQIQAASRADDAHDTAAEHSIYGGEGYWRIVTERESPLSFNQVIKIKPCLNPQLVLIDPDAKELDKSDADWGFIFEDVDREEFKREWPEIDMADWGDARADLSTDWNNGELVRIAEYYYCTYVPDTLLFNFVDGTGILKSKLSDAQYAQWNAQADVWLGADKSRRRDQIEIETHTKKWKWCKLVGKHKQPVDEKDWAGQYLPIVAVVGKEINVNGEVIRKGIVRDLKDPARMVNYSYSETIQTVALQNKIPYLAAAEAVEGYEDQWGRANRSNDSYLPWNAFDAEGNALPMPKRQDPPVMPAAQIQLLQISTEQMRAASGQQNANFGIKSEAASGVGIQRLKVQGETATFHFPDNLRRGLTYEAVILVDLIPKIYDEPRVVRILGLDNTIESAKLDPKAPQAYQEQANSDIKSIFNPTLGQYDVVIDTGPSYQTQRQEGFAALTELAGRDPALMQQAGDLIMQYSDIPGAQEIAKRLKMYQPAQIQSEDGDQTAQLAAQVQQMHQLGQQQTEHMQMMEQQLAEQQRKLDAQAAKADADKYIAGLNHDADMKRLDDDWRERSFRAETDRIKAIWEGLTPEQKQQIAVETLNDSASMPDLSIEPDPEGLIEHSQPVMAATGASPGPTGDSGPAEGTE